MARRQGEEAQGWEQLGAGTQKVEVMLESPMLRCREITHGDTSQQHTEHKHTPK